MEQFEIEGTVLVETIQQLDPSAKRSTLESKISKHKNGQPVHSTFIEQILKALSIIDPQARAFYGELLKSNIELEVPEKLKPTKSDLFEWIKTAKDREIAEIMDAIAARLRTVNASSEKSNGKAISV